MADVASVGGLPIEYQIDVDPNKLRAYDVTLGDLFSAVARSNSAVGGKTIQKGNAEYIVRGVGWIRGTKDIEDIVVRTDPETRHSRLRLRPRQGRPRARVPPQRAGKGGNEVVGGVVLMHHGDNPLEVTERIKKKIAEVQPGLPEGVRIVPFYDRTRLVHGAIEMITGTLTEEMIIASVAITLILMHLRMPLVICMTLPLAVLVSFILMRWFGIASNIMSLSGIAISIGILVDQAIVMVENATHHLAAHFEGRRVTGDIRELVIPACRTVGRPIFFSVMIILISFIPVFALTGRDGKTFHPLAFTKSFAMLGVAVLSITLVPALIPTFIRGRLRREEDSWLVRNLIAIYKPWLTWLMPRRNLAMWFFAFLLIIGAGLFPLEAITGIAWRTCFLAVVAVTVSVSVVLTVGWRWQVLSLATLAATALWASTFSRIGTDYMPPLDEGSILDMPVTVPRASITEVADDLKARDALLRRFPEVEMVVGKGGRADTPTDPSPLEMVETRHHAAAQGVLAPPQAQVRRRPAAGGRRASRPPGPRLPEADPAGVGPPGDPGARHHARRRPARRGALRIGDPALRRVPSGDWAGNSSASASPSWPAVGAGRASLPSRSNRPTWTARPGPWRRSSPRSSPPGRTWPTSIGSCVGSPSGWPPTGRSN